MKKSAFLFIIIIITVNSFAITARDKNLANKAYRLAKKYIEKNNYAKAKRFLIYAHRKNPNHPFVFPRLVVVLKKLKDFKTLTKYYESYAKKNPNNFSINFNMGAFALKAKVPVKAIKYFKKALKLKPNDNKTMYNLSLSYIEIENYKESLKYSLKVYKKNYNPKEVLKNIVKSYIKLKKFDNALKYSKKLVEITNWTNPFTISDLASIYAAKKNYKKAIELIKKAIAIRKTALFKIHLEKYKKLLKKQSSNNRPR